MLEEKSVVNDSQVCPDSVKNDQIFIHGVGVVSREDAMREIAEGEIGGIHIGNEFGFSDLEALQEDLNQLRREGSASEDDLAGNDDILIRIERKLKIREALKYQKLS